MAKQKRAKRPLTDVLAAARRNRYKVIHERNLLILALAKHAGFDAHLVPSDDPGEWDKVVCLHTPAGQLHWRLSPEDQKDFRSLETLRKSDYDGAKMAEKVERLEALHAMPSAAVTRLRAYEDALRAIVEGEPSCRCDHTDKFCCVKVEHYCPACIAAVALRDQETLRLWLKEK